QRVAVPVDPGGGGQELALSAAEHQSGRGGEVVGRSGGDRLRQRRGAVHQGAGRADEDEARWLAPHRAVLHEHRRSRELTLVLVAAILVLGRRGKSPVEG